MKFVVGDTLPADQKEVLAAILGGTVAFVTSIVTALTGEKAEADLAARKLVLPAPLAGSVKADLPTIGPVWAGSERPTR